MNESKANCPVLVGHLQALVARGGDHKSFALALVGVLDAVEHLASLADHASPAPRHVASHIDFIADRVLALRQSYFAIASADAVLDKLVEKIVAL